MVESIKLSRKFCEDYGALAWTRRADQVTAGYDALGGTGTQACANCLFFASPNRCTVVEEYPLAISPTGLSKFWTAIPEYRQPPIEVIIIDGDGAEGKAAGEPAQAVKAEDTKREGGVDYRAADFAVVPDESKTSTWKLRMAEGQSGKFTVAQVGRAITAIQPGGFRGNRVDLADGEKRPAIARIQDVIGKLDATSDQKDNLRERLGKVKDRPAWQFWKSVTPPMDPVGREPSAFYLEKDTEGDWRWFAWVSNHYRDRDNPPEILAADAHKEFVGYLDGGGTYPELWLWHTPGTKIGVADWADFADGFLVMSGTIDRDKDGIAEDLATAGDLGVSHGFRFTYSDKDARVIGFYRTFEVSALPLAYAANPWTGLDVVRKESTEMFSDAKRDFLTSKYGAETVANLERETELRKDTVDRLGVEWKDVEPAPVTQDHNAQGQATAKEIAEALAETEGFKALTGTMSAIKANADQVPAILARLEGLEKSDDAKIAAAIRPANGNPLANGQRASEASASKISEEEAAKLGAPDSKWGEMFGDIVKSVGA